VAGFPHEVLQTGAGIAQIAAGTSQWEFLRALFDDPRDMYYIIQGFFRGGGYFK
jgi:hypothetical protein